MARAIPLAILAVAGYAAFYLIACAVFPFGNCRRCHGTGKRRSPTGRSFRLCRRCEATGRRVRVGRRVYDYFRNEYEQGSKWQARAECRLRSLREAVHCTSEPEDDSE